jgi:hypothetical protein
MFTGYRLHVVRKILAKQELSFSDLIIKFFATELHRVVENHRVIPSVQLFFSAALCGLAVQKSSERTSVPINRDERR